MLVGMGVVGAIRVCAYYREALSTDIAKILPFALLGFMITDGSIVQITGSTEGVREAALGWETVVYYLVAVVALEFVLRTITGIIRFFMGSTESSETDESMEHAQTETNGAGRADLAALFPNFVPANATPGPDGLTIIQPRP